MCTDISIFVYQIRDINVRAAIILTSKRVRKNIAHFYMQGDKYKS